MIAKDLAYKKWAAAQDSGYELYDAAWEECYRLWQAWLCAGFEEVSQQDIGAWMAEGLPAPTPITEIDPQPTPSRLTGVVVIWSRDRGMGTIAASDGTCITFWKSGLTQSYTPGIGDNVTYRLGVSASRGEVSECAVGVTCTDMPAPVKTPAQLKAQTEDRKRRDLVQALAARREARQQKRMDS